MKRSEEILRKAMNSYPDCPERGFETGDYEYPEFHDDEREAFIKGAEWMQETMIDKFLYWLTMKSPFIDNKDMDKAIVELRKYLEE